MGSLIVVMVVRGAWCVVRVHICVGCALSDVAEEGMYPMKTGIRRGTNCPWWQKLREPGGRARRRSKVARWNLRRIAAAAGAVRPLRALRLRLAMALSMQPLHGR